MMTGSSFSLLQKEVGQSFQPEKESETDESNEDLPDFPEKQNLLDGLLHVFFPKRTPQGLQEDLDDIEDELLTCLTDYVDLILNSIDKTRYWKSTASMNKWTTLQLQSRNSPGSFVSTFLAELGNLNTTEKLPFYIRKQNCTIVFTKLEHNFRVETFRSCLPPHIVMSCVEPLSMPFPHTTNIVQNMELLHSSCFIKQILDLSNNDYDIAMPTSKKGGQVFPESRDPADPILVSELLVGMLNPVFNNNPTSFQIMKKIRDNINLKNSPMPFRRSGLWLSAKVTLHLILNEYVGPEDAKLIYKIILLRMMTDLCEFHSNYEQQDWDFTHQMLAKIGRRTKKLSELQISHKNMKLINLKEDTLKRVHSTVHVVHSKLIQIWKSISHSADEDVQEIYRTDEEFKTDLLHNIPLLNSYLKSKREPGNQKHLDGTAGITPVVRQKSIQELLLGPMKTETADINLDADCIWLYDVEELVRGEAIFKNASSRNILELMKVYAEKATNRLKNLHDPVVFSRIVQTLLFCYMKLDEIATGKFLLLKEYETGIDTSVFCNLLVLEDEEQAFVNKTELYFSTRNKKAKFLNILAKSAISNKSFSARFAETNKLMIKLRNAINLDIQDSIENKFMEIEKAKEKCEKIQQTLDTFTECDYTGFETHHRVCRRCKTTALLKNTRKSVRRYEMPLPNQTFLQNSIVFELLIPEEISFLRDALAFIKMEILQEPILDGLEYVSTPTTWVHSIVSYRPLQKYKNSYQELHTDYQPLVTLKSSSKPVSASHYGNTPNRRSKSRNIDICLNSRNQFIILNGMTCILSYTPVLKDFSKPSDPFSFQIQTTSGAAPYESLQQYVSETNNSQNAMIARSQYSCHPDITTTEFYSFASLRIGHRIQVRNLYKFLSDRTLNVEKEPVLALVLQTIWECGPLEPEEVVNQDLGKLSLLRSSSTEFCNVEFSKELLHLLETLINAHAKNWSSPLTLVTAVVIINKILETSLEPNVNLPMCISLLRRVREITCDWIKTLEKLLLSSENSEEESSFMRTKLLQILICSAFTYGSAKAFTNDFSDSNESTNDVVNWLTTVFRMNYYVNLEQTHLKISPFMAILLQYARQVTPLKCERHLHAKIQEYGFSSLEIFVNSVWKNLLNAPIKTRTWTQCLQAKKQHTYEGKFVFENGDTHVLHVDILFGKFLVDGYPPSNLPTSITQNSLYRSYFNCLNFTVQRASSTFTTTHEIHGKIYSFFISKNKSLICREIQNNGKPILELLDPEMFSDNFSPTLISNYTHWLDYESKKIYFRKKSNNRNKSDSDIQQVDYSLRERNGQWLLHDENLKKCLLSIKSDGHDLISRILSKIEEVQHIYTFIDNENNGKISVRLPRMGLNFILENTLLHSLEYKDSYITINQEKGCFVGLKDSLLLERKTYAETDAKKYMILVPHGKIQTEFEYKKQYHQCTTVSKEVLRQPPFYAFEMDKDLQRLKADKSKSAWLYLAGLHAATSSCLPDEFTGMTGTEMAMWILQSGLVWSSSPYDTESIDSLRLIQNFSPRREYYPPHRQKQEIVTWSPLPSYPAYDGYHFVVKKLIQDSERLKDLIPGNCDECPQNEIVVVSKLAEKLHLRAYWRHIYMYNPTIHFNEIDGILIGVDSSKPINLTVRKSQSCSVLHEISAVRNTSNGMDCSVPSPHLVKFLITPEPVCGIRNFEELTKGNLIDIGMQLDIRKDWLRLCFMAHSLGENLLEHEFTTLLCVMAYLGDPKEQLLNLHYISKFRLEFPYPATDFSGKDYLPTNHKFSFEKTKTILKEAIVPFAGNIFSLDYDKEKIDYEVSMEKTAETYANTMINLRGDRQKLFKYCHDYLNSNFALWRSGVSNKIEKQFSEWQRNLDFKIFITEVETKLKSIYAGIGQITTNVPEVQICIKRKKEDNLSVNIGSYCDLNQLPNHEKMKLIYTTGQLPHSDQSNSTPLSYDIKFMVERLSKSLISSHLAEILQLCGLFPRLAPPLLFRRLLNDKTIPEPVINTIGAIAVLLTYSRQTSRCIRYAKQGDPMALELKREKENKGHTNWSPKERPEWLLLELDLDLMIRPIQVQVAEHMMNMPSGRNGVMQLNMGEGKTSLIVPMLVSVLASIPDTLCRVTVLPSIFNTNLDILSFAVGGLLNRRVYVIQCRRDAIIEKHIPTFWELYKECQEKKGVVLTLPEYRLSQRLLIYEKLQSNNDSIVSVGLNLLELENWLRKNCRDILDESDELLNPKYQFIYTLGEQISLGGGSMRWMTCQKILRLVPKILDNLSSSYGGAVVEFDTKNYLTFPDQFIPCRLLSDECQQDFYSMLADAVLDKDSDLLGIILPDNDRQLVKNFLTEEEITKDVNENVQKIFSDDDNRLDTILLLSGYIRRGILKLALSKRWRVEYGVDPNGRRKMAVPFRAKDVAADRTEFGHPDVAIVLTHLSYYYSGLTDEQLNDCFHLLKTMLGPESIYHEWISHIQNERVHHSIKSYKGVNLRDYVQRTKYLFPVLRKNKQVIDFWLTHKVFPRESKQFPGKITTTAWDLCYERNKHPTVGFSGTNDSSILLPKPITQQDLPELQTTNKEMEEILKRPENSHNRHLRMGVSCKEILELMKRDDLKVLIDAGALMLELHNEQIAQLWLEVDDQIDAVVYFNDKSELHVKVRRNNASAQVVGKSKILCSTETAFELSPYRERLDKCAVFLDDQHTRGTDLKFPNGFKACVTVGSGMRRDKLIQASMRMRKLGAGHSVSFYLSNDVYNKISKVKISTTDILNWVRANSKQFEKDGLVHWALAGKNYAQKLAAEDIFHYPNEHNPSNSTGPVKEFNGYEERARILGDQCKDDEVVKLRDMYGSHLKNQLVPNLTYLMFARCQDILELKNGTTLPLRIRQDFLDTWNGVWKWLNDFIPDKKQLACNLDEEQEKELEPEHDEIRFIKKPSTATPLDHKLHEKVILFVSHGAIPAEVDLTSGLLRLQDIFKGTTFWDKVQSNNWHSEICVSEDFVRVIDTSQYSGHLDMDGYLRQITYIASLTTSEKCYLLLLSPFEANELMAPFRQKIIHPNVKLHLFSPRYLQGQDILINNPGLQLPTVNPTVIKENLLAPLLLASGTLFFETMREQKAYADFLGFIPRPWSHVPVLEDALEMGGITKTGFLLPKFRQFVRNMAEQEGCSVDVIDQVQSVFNSDPTSLVNSILENRNPGLRESAHVKQLLNKCAFVEIDEDEEVAIIEG